MEELVIGSQCVKAFLILNTNNNLYPLSAINTIGSGSSCNIYISENKVEHRHTRIEIINNKYILSDLQSSSGTRLNGTKILKAELSHGDEIQIGEIELIFSHTALKPQKPCKTLNSKNAKWSKELSQVPKYASCEHPVILIGPSGSGKDIVARKIHELSKRCDENFVSINCSALSPQLIESELFGHLKGSFTGAESDRKGAFVEAHRGTLFLDEIGDLPLNLQPKLLRALENSEIKPVGADKSKKVNVRIIAATHKQLEQLVSEGKFRSDLYFRLNVLKLQPPKLVDRMEDFEDLFYHFAKTHRVRFNHAAIQSLKNYDWPGNIRELKNFIIKASVKYMGELVTVDKTQNLFDELPLQINSIVPKEKREQLKKVSLIEQNEFNLICDALIEFSGNQRKAALKLGMPTSTLNDRIRTHKIDVKKIKQRCK